MTDLIGDIVGPYALISRPYRSIGMIIPDVTIEEIHVDAMAITDHPVETGAAISDHAFMQPAEVEMRIGWSNVTGGSELYSRQIYAQLRELQASRDPFDVSTGKRQYRNMLIRNLMVSTTVESENALMVIASLREVVITNTSTSGAAQSAQAQPQKTASVQDLGVKPTLPYTGSLPVFASGVV